MVRAALGTSGRELAMSPLQEPAHDGLPMQR
jgi:hypothetical protein